MPPAGTSLLGAAPLVVAVCSSSVLATSASLSGTAKAVASFDEYCADFGKSYGEGELPLRRALFEERTDEIAQLNSRPRATWTAGLSPLTDLTTAEIHRHFGYSAGHLAGDEEGTYGSPDLGAEFATLAVGKDGPSSLPEEIDWRLRSPSVVTPPKNQFGCGSCWAFASVAVMETHLAIATGVLLDLSPQQLVSCVENPDHCGGTGGCQGATAQLAFNYTIDKGGLATIWSAPYISGLYGYDEECNDSWEAAAAMTISGYRQLPKNDAGALLSAVAMHGPLVVAVDASQWLYYRSGIFDGCNKSSPVVNHGVVLMGYGEDQGVKYWLVRNSWGVMFGEAGYIRLRRYGEEDGGEPCGMDTQPLEGLWCEGGPAEVEVCGECGILVDAVYPIGLELVGDEHRRLQTDAGSMFV